VKGGEARVKESAGACQDDIGQEADSEMVGRGSTDVTGGEDGLSRESLKKKKGIFRPSARTLRRAERLSNYIYCEGP